LEKQTTRRVIVAGAFAGLLASVYLANWLVQNVGIIRVWPTDLLAPSGVYMAGVAFLFRDTVQRLASVQLAVVGIACGAALSWFVSPTLAGASAAAFTASELTGLVVLALLGRRLTVGITASQLAAAAVDSAVFLWLAFHSLAFWQGQVVAKVSVLAIAYPVVYGWRRYTDGRPAVFAR
jgi:hypothetical protein